MIPWYVRPKGALLNLFTNQDVANSIYPFIFLPKEVYEELVASTPSLVLEALLIHEETHRSRQANNFLLYWIKYLTQPTFRDAEEKFAVTEAIRYLKERGYKISLDEMKSNLDQNFLFLYPVSKLMTKEELAEFVRTA